MKIKRELRDGEGSFGQFFWTVVIIAFLLIGGAPRKTTAQSPEDVVRWTASGPAGARPGGHVILELNADIEDGWHIYSVSQLPGGPTTSVISFPGKQTFRRDGMMQVPSPNKSFDPNFNMETETYEGRINFKIPLSVEDNAPLGDQKIAIDVLYQTCNESTCLPPHKTHLFVPIKILSDNKSAAAETSALDGLEFGFVDFTGRQRKISEFRGKYVLIDFWATWCKPCLADIPKLRELYGKYKASGFEIVGMDSETLGDEADAPDPEFAKQTAERARQIVATRGVTWTEATSETAVPVAMKIFGVKSLPTKILLNREGHVVATIGEKDDLTETIEKYLDVK